MGLTIHDELNVGLKKSIEDAYCNFDKESIELKYTGDNEFSLHCIACVSESKGERPFYRLSIRVENIKDTSNLFKVIYSNIKLLFGSTEDN